MSTKFVSRVLSAAFIVTALGTMLFSSVASAGQTGCSRCQACGHVCKLDAELVDVEKKCFEVESKVICIPKVVFPWQKGKKRAHSACDACDGRGCNSCNNCVHNGAKTRKICVLKTSKKKVCPECKYTWTAEKTCCDTGCSDGGCCDKGCCDAGCDSGCCDAAPVYSDAAPVMESAPQPVPMPVQ